ncbi:MAG: hypothetical protein II862_07010, partial [Bacteroidales bacterium]|nr:hypothetical protein [Bacteroidales bacterium]
LFSLNLGFRLDVLFGVPSTGSLPRAAHAALVLCWPQTFKDLPQKRQPLLPSLFCGLQKYSFYNYQQQKNNNFFKKIIYN